MTTACIIAAVCILIAGLFAVIVERTTERDDAREAAERAGRERDAAETAARIATELLAQREADARVVVPIRRCSCGHPTGASGIHSEDCAIWAGMSLRSVPAQRQPDHLAADDAWFDRLYDDKGNLR